LRNGTLKILSRTIGSAVLGAGDRTRLSILIYHRVLPEPDELLANEIDTELFQMQMEIIADTFNVLPLAEAVERLKRRELPPRSACITFDDGYANNATHALPILQELSLPACFFIATGFLDGSCMWNDIIIEAVRGMKKRTLNLESSYLGTHRLETRQDRIAAIGFLLPQLKKLDPSKRSDTVEQVLREAEIDRPVGMMMSPAQVRSLTDSGMEVGAHTVSHPILRTLSEQQSREEIANCKIQLEEITGRPISLFAYPNGRPGRDFSRDHVGIVKELGYLAAVTTAKGAATCSTDRFLLPRFTPWDRTRLRFLFRMYQNAL
jgi:peptidoglycan/xylan/chitin deacetylase (PgdA/CDA1 family)